MLSQEPVGDSRESYEDGMIDIEELLNFAIEAAGDLDILWKNGDQRQKLRLQNLVFPDGLEFDGSKFGTARTSFIFNMLGELEKGKSTMVGDTGFEPVTSTV